MTDYTLVNFFEEYKFHGKIGLAGKNAVNFTMEVYKYDPKTGLFIGHAEDERGLSAIVGSIRPHSVDQCDINFDQTFRRPLPEDAVSTYNNGGHIVRTREPKASVDFRGCYFDHDGEIRTIAASVVLRISRPAMGWMQNAIEMQFPK